MVVMDERVGGWFLSWKWFDVLVNEEEDFRGKVCMGGERVWFSMGL